MPSNNGQWQIGSNLLAGGGEYIFANRLKGGGYFDRSGLASKLPIGDRDANGYPTRLDTTVGVGGTPGAVTSAIGVESYAQYSGYWVLGWSAGAGTVGVTGQNGYKPGFSIADQTSTNGGRVVVSIASSYLGVPDGTGIRISASTFGNHIRGMYFCREDQEAAYLAMKAAYPDREPLNPDFVTKMLARNPGRWRNLDLGNYNDSIHCLWANRVPVDHFSYTSTYVKPELCANDVMTNVGDDYTQSFSGFVLSHGETVIVTFNATSTGNFPTIDVNGTGRKNIFNRYGDPLNSSNKPMALYWCALVYDATLDCYLKNGDVNTIAGLTAMVPPEVFVDACIDVGASPHLMSPYLSFDSGTHTASDWALQQATMVRAKKIARDAAWVKEVYEVVPNETWNYLFAATHYADLKAIVNWPTVGLYQHSQWCGKVASIYGQMLAALYGGGLGTTYKASIGIHSDLHPNIASSEMIYRFNSQRYHDENGGLRANDYVSGLLWTNYHGAIRTNRELISSGKAATYWGSDATARQATIDWFVGTDRPPGQMSSVDYEFPLLTCLNNLYSWARNILNPPIEVECYEGGTSFDLINNDDAVFPEGRYQTITAATKNINCAIELPLGHAGVVNGYVYIIGVLGMTQLNGKVGKILGVSGRIVTTDIDSSTFSTFVASPESSARPVERVAIAGASKAASCILTLPSGVGCWVGQTLPISDVVGMTELNGAVHTVSAVNGPSVTLNRNSSSYGAYVSGGYAYIGYRNMVNRVRVRAYRATNHFWITQSICQAMAALPYAGFPSQFLLSGGRVVATDDAVSSQPWGLFHDDIFGEECPSGDALTLFSAGKKKRWRSFAA
jgi:hypothetical protein